MGTTEGGRVAAVVVTFRRPRHLAATLRALLDQTHPPEVVVVVDNGADGGARTARTMLGNPPTVSVLESPENVGFAGGLQIGIDHIRDTSGDIWAVLTCDDDSQAGPDLLADAVDVMALDERIGMVTTRPGTDHLFGLRWGSDAAPRVGQVDHALLRLAAIAEVPFRGDLFMMLEDVDLSRRLRRAGWRIAVVDASVDRAWLGAEGYPPWRVYYQTRNELRLAIESRRPREAVAASVRLMRHVLIAVHLGVTTRNPRRSIQLLLARGRGIRDALGGRMGRHPRYPDEVAPAAPRRPVDHSEVRRITIVVPVRNEQTRITTQITALVRCIEEEAADRQVRLIVADNGSTDATATVARRALSGLAWAQVIDAGARRGAAAARNIAVAAGEADAYLFTDADDVVEPGWLRAHLRGLDAGADITVGGWWIPQRGGSRQQAHTRLTLWGRPYALGANHGVRRRVFESVGGYSEAVGFIEDAEFSWRAQDAGFRMVTAPDAVIRRALPQGSRARFSRHLAYGRGQRHLLAWGLSPLPARVVRWSALRQLAWLVLHASDVLDDDGRGDWLGRAGRSLGLLLPLPIQTPTPPPRV